MKTKQRKRIAARILSNWIANSNVWFSASGGTCRILAEIVSSHFDLNIISAIRLVNRVAENSDGFFYDSWERGYKGDARGFQKYLERNGF
jgi:hypothetical protein